MAQSIRNARRFSLTQDSLMIVRLDIAEKDGKLFVTSPNLPGLNAYGFGAEGAYESVVRMVKALFRHNGGFEVDVWPATTDGSEFPKMMHLCDAVVVRRRIAKKPARVIPFASREAAERIPA